MKLNQVWATTNLAAKDWTTPGNMESTNGIWRFFDSTATNFPQRFHREKQLQQVFDPFE